LLFIVLLVGLFGRDGGKPTNEHRIQAILAAKSPIFAARSYRELFKSTKVDDLRRLQLSTSPTIAVQAAWQEINHTASEQKLKQALRR
jgi:hypothetical protein